MKQLETAMKIHRMQPEYHLLMGECKLQLNLIKEAVQCFSTIVRLRPKNISGWEALIRCLYKGGFYNEARQQTLNALQNTNNKPLFFYYLSAVLFAQGKSKEALLYLEKGLAVSPKILKRFIELNPAILQNSLVVDVIAQRKRKR
jgi:tetratricopeptide (TPR) repeat protein